MCGISGFLDTAGRFTEQELTSAAVDMANTLYHRGPDDGGTWVDARAGIALGHRRLSILDLSPQGHQPMRCRCGRYVLVFNGEIYNFQELRQELAGLGQTFRGHSDTEVMLEYICHHGLSTAITRCNGMFACALWDREERTLYLMRDRLGEKPLYYGWMGATFVFASELKALRAHPQFNADVNRDALALYTRYAYVPAPYSIYNHVSKITPGTVAVLRSHSGKWSMTCTEYWSVRDAAERGMANPFPGSESEAIASLDELLRDAIKLRMEADVPLGAFLSGGLDSSTVVALMQAQTSKPVHTFTIGFHEAAYNEAIHAKAVAAHLGTDHRELYVSPEEARAVIPRLPDLYDEPFADSSQIPTYLLSALVRRHVTVSLSGDAGDELFGGYDRYFLALKIWNMLRYVPAGARQAAASLLTSVPRNTWTTLLGGIGPLLYRSKKSWEPGDKVHKLAEILAVRDCTAMYHRLVSHWKSPASLVHGAMEPATVLTDRREWPHLSAFAEQMMYVDTRTYLPDDILVKVDRAAMGVSLETRIPFLDHRIVELVWRLPLSMKMRGQTGKWLLRQLLYRYVPKALIERPKMGFGVPIEAWLRGPLREWAESLLNETRLRNEGFFSPEPIRKKWAEHLSGHRDWAYELWDVLMFQGWLESIKDGHVKR
ncbi:asparagine synthase (glutamine-hydrolyzing) [Nitrospira sp. Nam74]